MIAHKGISLHIGVNQVDPGHYGGWSGPLVACEADADDLLALALAQGFDGRTLKTSAATRHAVRSGIEDAASRLAPGGIFLLTYSGHGGQVPDSSGDEDDLKDETWCLYDAQLVDDELYELWHGFPEGTRVLVLSDSCHSGTAVRAPSSSALTVSLTQGPLAEMLGTVGAAIRCMPDPAAVRTYRLNREFYDGLQQQIPTTRQEIAATVRLISGCQDNQLSLDGSFNGLFTGQLLRVWNRGRFQGSYGEFHKAILSRMPATQSPNHLVIGRQNSDYDAERAFTI